MSRERGRSGGGNRRRRTERCFDGREVREGGDEVGDENVFRVVAIVVESSSFCALQVEIRESASESFVRFFCSFLEARKEGEPLFFSDGGSFAGRDTCVRREVNSGK
jgi:hypothetical protein